MALVKIFLPTFKRNQLLVRCVESVRSQTLTDWTCEIHNDDPDNRFPRNYITSLKDPRFVIVDHIINLGPVATFNLMFEPGTFKYLCLLEDDNWWENNFLAVMVQMMDKHGVCDVGFSNINLWKEGPADRWEKMTSTLWPENRSQVIEYIFFPRQKQVLDYYHSNCSTMIRNSFRLKSYAVPDNIRIDFIEAIQERAFPHPLLFVNEPLANFALTIHTTRNKTLKGLYEHYFLLIDSFFKFNLKEGFEKSLWEDARKDKSLSYIKLMYAGILSKSSRKLLNFTKPGDWLILILFTLKRPQVFWGCFRAKHNYSLLWKYLSFHTYQRVADVQKSIDS